MTKNLLTILGLGLMVTAAHAEDQKTNSTGSTNVFKNERERLSYAVGLGDGMNWKRMGIDLDLDTVVKGMKDGMGPGPALLTEQEMRETFKKANQELQAKTEQKKKIASEKNKKEGADFLAKNKTVPGVIPLPSGLQYTVLTQGSGDSPKADDTVVVNYRGTLIDGTEFDSTAKTGHPLSRPANGFIPGWTEALQLMKPGAKWKLFVPSNLAYGPRGFGQSIGPDATLIFEVELVSWSHPAPTAPPQPLTSDIIKVPSAEELKKGAKIETIKPEDIEKEKAKELSKGKTTNTNN
jgi:FKBP-type peptidyl-prolyl cis-trans isomerase FklB